MPFNSPYAPYSGYATREGDDGGGGGRKRAPPAGGGGGAPSAPFGAAPAPAPAQQGYASPQNPAANLTGGYVPLANYLYAQQGTRAPGMNGYGGQMAVDPSNPYAGTGAAQYDAATNHQRGIIDPATIPSAPDASGGGRDVPERGGGPTGAGGGGGGRDGGGGLGDGAEGPSSDAGTPSDSNNGLDPNYSSSFSGPGGAAYKALLKWLDS